MIDELRAFVELVRRNEITCSCCDSNGAYKEIRDGAEQLLASVERRLLDEALATRVRRLQTESG